MAATTQTRGGWSNWTGSRASRIAREVAPTSESEVADIIAAAVAAGQSVRAVGNGYSWAESVAAGGVVVRTGGLSGIRGIDADAGVARVGGGARLHDVCVGLWDAGFELPTLGGFAGQTIAGVVSTATHGSGVGCRSVSAYARAVRIIDARGHVETVRDEERLRAARVGLGSLGVITELEMKVVPASWLRIRDSWHERVDLAWFRTDDGIRRAVRWHPHGGHPDGRPVHLREWVPAAPTEEGALPSHAALATAGAESPAPFSVTELAVPLARADAAIGALADVLRGQAGLDTGMPLALRVVASDDAFLSPYAGGARLTVSAAAPTADQGAALFGAVHEALLPYGARPHWAKEHLFTPTMIAERYEALARFAVVRRGFDPDEVFLTAELRRILGAAGERRGGANGHHDGDR